MQFESYLSHLQKEHDWSQEFILPAFGAWLGNEFINHQPIHSIGIDLGIDLDLPFISVLLSGLRCLYPESDFTLLYIKSKDTQVYMLSRLCKCLGVFKTTDPSGVEACSFIFREELICKIQSEVGSFMRRLFAESQRKLTLFDQQTYMPILNSIEKRNNVLERFDYSLNHKGDVVFSQFYHLERGNCCGSGCVNCPYGQRS